MTAILTEHCGVTKMLRLHEYNARDFSGGCLAVLSKAAEVAVTENLQQPYTIGFEYPMDDDKADMIQENRIVSVDGQGYRLDSVTRDYSGTKMITAKGTHVCFADAQTHHIPTIGNDTNTTDSTIGCDPYKVIRKAVEGTDFTLLSDNELHALNMGRIGENEGEVIDFYPTDKINLYDVVTAVIEAYGKGELYVDNYKFAVVRQIGHDNGVRLSLRKNLSKLTVERQTTELCTRLYPYGKDDMTISGLGNIQDGNGFYIHRSGNAYIESPNKGIYGVIEGYKDYSDFTDTDKLYSYGLYDLMGEDNENRLDTPKITISGELVELAKLSEYGDIENISLGDVVHVREGDIVHSKRVVSITRYPYSAKQPSVTIGAPSNSDPYFVVWNRENLLKSISKNFTKSTNKIKSVNSTSTVKSPSVQTGSVSSDMYTVKFGGVTRIEFGIKNNAVIFNIRDRNGNPLLNVTNDAVEIAAETVTINGRDILAELDALKEGSENI